MRGCEDGLHSLAREIALALFDRQTFEALFAVQGLHGRFIGRSKMRCAWDR